MKKPDKTKNNRGRPTKTFVSKKQTEKRDKPGRPPKKIEPVNKQTIEKPQTIEIPHENKTKDRIIFIMFIISLVIFCFSIYTSRQKAISEKILIEDTIAELTNTGNTNTGDKTESVPTVKETPIETGSPEETTLEEFYKNINNKNFKGINAMIDNGLKQSNTYKTYFSSKRLTRFVDNLDKDQITYKINKITTGANNQIEYTLNYKIKDGKEYEENRLISINNKTSKIKKIICSTEGCSRMPFFNPGKYDLK